MTVPGDPQAKPEPGEDDQEILLRLGDILPRIPANLLKPGSYDPQTPVRFLVDELAQKIAQGRVTVPLIRLVSACPQIFRENKAFEDEAEVHLPLQKVLEQVGLIARKTSAANGVTRDQVTHAKAEASRIMEAATSAKTPPEPGFPIPPEALRSRAVETRPAETQPIAKAISVARQFFGLFSRPVEVRPEAGRKESAPPAKAATEKQPAPAATKTPAAPTTPAQPPAGPAGKAAPAGYISLRALPVFRLLPTEIFRSSELPPEEARINLPLAAIDPQLPGGHVEVPLPDFIKALPFAMRQNITDVPGALVWIPLDEIFQNLPPDHLFYLPPGEAGAEVPAVPEMEAAPAAKPAEEPVEQPASEAPPAPAMETSTVPHTTPAPEPTPGTEVLAKEVEQIKPAEPELPSRPPATVTPDAEVSKAPVEPEAEKVEPPKEEAPIAVPVAEKPPAPEQPPKTEVTPENPPADAQPEEIRPVAEVESAPPAPLEEPATPPAPVPEPQPESTVEPKAESTMPTGESAPPANEALPPPETPTEASKPKSLAEPPVAESVPQEPAQVVPPPPVPVPSELQPEETPAPAPSAGAASAEEPPVASPPAEPLSPEPPAAAAPVLEEAQPPPPPSTETPEVILEPPAKAHSHETRIDPAAAAAAPLPEHPMVVSPTIQSSAPEPAPTVLYPTDLPPAETPAQTEQPPPLEEPVPAHPAAFHGVQLPPPPLFTAPAMATETPSENPAPVAASEPAGVPETPSEPIRTIDYLSHQTGVLGAAAFIRGTLYPSSEFPKRPDLEALRDFVGAFCEPIRESGPRLGWNRLLTFPCEDFHATAAIRDSVWIVALHHDRVLSPSAQDSLIAAADELAPGPA